MKIQSVVIASFTALGLAALTPVAASAETAPAAYTLVYDADEDVSNANLYTEARYYSRRGFHGNRGFHRSRGFHSRRGFNNNYYYGGRSYRSRSFNRRGFDNHGFRSGSIYGKGVHSERFQNGFHGKHGVVVKKKVY